MSGQSLFRTLLGPSFDELPLTIREVHQGIPSLRLSGVCAIERGSHWFARLAGAVAGMPEAAAEVPVRVRIDADASGERWNRHFGQRRVYSRLRAHRGLLVERLGPLTIAFRLDVTGQRISWTPQAGRVFGVALPARFFRGVTASESALGGRYSFDVRAALPMIGLVIHYRGWLKADEQ